MNRSSNHRLASLLHDLSRRMRAVLVASLALAMLLPFGAHASVRMAPPEEGNSWYYSDVNPYYRYPDLAPRADVKSGSYVIGNCAWYAWGRASEMAGKAVRVDGSPDNMWATASSAGYQTGSEPQVGAICIGISNGSPHASVVERVEGGRAIVSESAYRTASTWPGYGQVVFHLGPVDEWTTSVWGYIYVQDDVAHSDKWERISGYTAYDTMREVVRADDVFTDGRGGTVVVATGGGYWDALSATGLAGLLDAPVLITPKDELAEQARDELQRLAPNQVIIAGGAAAIGEGVEDEIRQMGMSVTRLKGKTAADTAVEMYQSGAQMGTWDSTAIVATSNGYWDALSIAPFAYAKKAPIFLTSYQEGGGQALGKGAMDAIAAGGFSRVVIVGGAAAVSKDVEGQLESAGVADVVRLAGATALDTSASIASWELGQGMGLTHLAVATSNGYWDALTGTALAGKQNSVLVLVDNSGHYQAFDAAYVASAVSHGHVLGGSAAISMDAWNWLVTQ